jgi:DNA-binding Lrp family transcriptional regulator
VAHDIAQFPEVFGLALVYGAYDLVAHILLRDREHVHRVMKEDLPGVPGVRELTLNLVTEVAGYRLGATSEAVAVQPPLELPAPRIPLDATDLALIEALALDGRQSNREVARQLGVSEGTVRSRLRRLEDAGLIRVVATADRQAIGEIAAIAIVGVQLDGPIASAVGSKLARLPEVYMVSVTVGRYDLILIAATQTRAELGDLTAAKLRSIHGVRSTETLDVIEVPKQLHRWVRLGLDPLRPNVLQV